MNKCRVENQHAKIVGEDQGGVNHYFFKHWSMLGYASGTVKFLCQRSTEWEVDDEVYFEVHYNGAWHANTNLTVANTIEGSFVLFEIPLGMEMMTYDFGVRFRNGMSAAGEYLEVDDFYLYGNPSIPALSEWGMIVLVGLLLLAGMFFIMRKRRPAHQFCD